MVLMEGKNKAMNNRRRLSRLLHRDNYLCGIHIDGCGSKIPSRAEASLDHIFTRSFFKDRERRHNRCGLQQELELSADA